jgi:PHD/YefM family antitoxin component YafN of YafNO toxin-antitoxin module
MKVLELETTDLTLIETAKLARSGPVILIRKGKPVAAIRALSEDDWESLSLAENPRFQALIDEARRNYREQGGLSSEQVRKKLGLKPSSRRCGRTRKS